MKYYYDMIIRWILALLPIGALSFVITPLTIYTAYFVLSVYNPVLNGNIITINNINFEFVSACIIIYAYYFLWILTMLTKDIETKIRIKMILIGFLAIFLMNIFRIALVISLAIDYGFYWFSLVHLLFWKFLSGVYVALVWIFLVKHYNINSIPVYSDFKTLYKEIIKK